MTYQEALDYVSALAPRGWRLGLDRMQEFARRAELDRLSQKFVHIAGTNGKGSVTAFVQSLLIEQGFKTGAFFSPFVYDPRERVQIGRDLISEQDFVEAVLRLAPIAESMEGTDFQGPTEFEFKTAIGFDAWKRTGCEWVSLEVGLGGRLDATNIITPEVSIIVSIGLDHMAILGNTLEEIAGEKGGILKPGVPAVIGEMDASARDRLISMARERECPLWQYGPEVRAEWINGAWTISNPARTYAGLISGLKGPIQGHNLAVAIAALDACQGLPSPDAVPEGARKAFCPGRYEQRGRYILDGAHNPAAARQLVEILKSEGHQEGSLVLLTSMVNGHESLPFYRELAPMVREAIVGPIDFPRAQAPERIASAVAEAGIPVVWHECLADALDEAENREGTILVAGSFYFVGEVGNLLKA